MIKHLSLATAGAAFIMGTVGGTPTSAATFNFSGYLQRVTPILSPPLGSPFAVQGSYTISDDIVNNLLQQPLDRNDPSSFDLNARRVSGAVTSFSLSDANGNSLLSSPVTTNSFVTTYIPTSSNIFSSDGPVLNVSAGQVLSSVSLLFSAGSEPNLSRCLEKECVGFLSLGQNRLPGNYEGFISQTPASVPEPTSAIGELALGVAGVFMLLRKRKLLSSRGA